MRTCDFCGARAIHRIHTISEKAVDFLTEHDLLDYACAEHLLHAVTRVKQRRKERKQTSAAFMILPEYDDGGVPPQERASNSPTT